MPTTKDLNNLVINKIESQEVYDYMVQNNLINDDELYLIQGEEQVDIEIDSALSETSENPVQNKVVTSELNNKFNEAKSYTDEEVNKLAAGVAYIDEEDNETVTLTVDIDVLASLVGGDV